MKTEIRIVLGCFTGAALGAIVALQLDLLWWTGVLAGGATGYLTYNLGEVLHAIRIVWKHFAGRGLNVTVLANAFRNAMKLIAVLTCIVLCAASALALLIGAIMLLAGTAAEPVTWQGASAPPESSTLPVFFWILAGAGLLIPGMVVVLCILRSADRVRAFMGTLGCIAATPLLLPITLGIIFVVAVAPAGARALLKMTRQAFILIHSEARLLCLTDALIGALIGYFCGNALFGGVAGAALGWLNYRFVSVKWLRLVKA